MNLSPYGPVGTILVNHRPIPEATPTRLWRKQNNAAILDFKIPRVTYARLKDVEKEFRPGSLIEFYLGIGTGSQRVFYGYLPSVTSTKPLDPEDTDVTLTAYDFIGALTDVLINLSTET